MTQHLGAIPLLLLIVSLAGAISFLLAGIVLSVRRGSPHPLLLVCIAALSISWIEAPYDWSMYVEFPPGVPRMPTWWPLNLTWGGGLPQVAIPGYMFYFVLPALISVPLSRWASSKFKWTNPIALLTTGLVVGTLWAFCNNAFLGAQLGCYRYGRVIDGLALWPGTIHQYPFYDSLAMGVQMMVFTYLLGRRDSSGRLLVQAWADSKAKGQPASSLLSIAAVIVVGHVVYLSVFAPHLITKVLHLQTVAPSEQLYDSVPNQPL